MRAALTYLISILVMILCIPMGCALLYALIDHQGQGIIGHDGYAFLISIALGLLVGSLGYRSQVNKGVTAQIRPTDSFLIVTLTWIVAALFGALPYFIYGLFEQKGCGLLNLTPPPQALGVEFCSFTNSFFESMSGFTTTGATIIERGLWHSYTDGVGYLADGQVGLPRSVMLWRCFTHLLGGMGIVVLGVAILPVLGVGGMQLYHAEVPGPMSEQFAPRVGEGAKLLWKIYGVMTVALAALYWIFGMDFFEAFCHSMSTMATGGFSTRAQSFAGFESASLEWITVVFMFLAGVNFTLYTLTRSSWRSPLKVLRGFKNNKEFITYTIIIIITILTIGLSLMNHGELPGHDEPVRTAAFQVLSVITTTGYATADFELWGAAPVALFMMICLMFVGGCAGSTGGGVKVIRHLLLYRFCLREFFYLLHPTGKKSIRNDHMVVSPNILRAVMGFIGLYMLIFILGALYFVFEGQDVVTALTATIASLGNIGPGLSEVGPTDDFSGLSAMGKWVSASLMLMGRLELLTVLILFTPSYWRARSLSRAHTHLD